MLVVGLSNPTRRESSIYALLQCYVVLAMLVLETTSLRHEMVWDSYRDQFEQAVKLCHKVIQHERAEVGSSSNTGSVSIIVLHRYTPASQRDQSETTPNNDYPLTFNMGIRPILFHVVQKYRDARVRHDAIMLLEGHPRLEGLWDSFIIAQIGRIIDSVEQNGASLEEAAARSAPAAERVLSIRENPSINSRTANGILVKAKGEGETDVVHLQKAISW
jgi:hypothetical protein